MTQWPQPCATRVPATSLKAHTCTWLMCCFLFAETISMASSNDTEGTLTPVDFIQLQHYMECKSRLVGCNYYCNFLSMKGQLWEHFVIRHVIKMWMNGVWYTCLQEMKSCGAKNILLNTQRLWTKWNGCRLLVRGRLDNGQWRVLLSGSGWCPWWQALE